MSEPDEAGEGSAVEPYAVVFGGKAARALADRLPEKVVAAVLAFVFGDLAANPHRVGKALHEPLTGHSARRGAYRVLYEIDDAKRVVTITDVAHRADAYRP